MRIAVDLDGTLRTEERRFDKLFAFPKTDEIKLVNKLHDEGHEIFIFTACNWEEYNITKAWLDLYGVKYDALVCGKPNYDMIIDDRSKKTVREAVDELSSSDMFSI